ncbi:MAG: S9 family peptidase, partial [Taibaiella sp.]|nr:S9 family peptidase [Taibaiella sp.]
MRKVSICTLLLSLGMNINAQDRAAFKGQYPETKKSADADTYFGTKVNDPYRWLEDDLSEETKDWVQRQNIVTRDYLSKIPFRTAIQKRLTELWNYEKYSAPFKEGEYTYFYKNDGLQNQYVLYRQKGNGQPEVFLDPNKFSKDGTTSLAGISFTKDGSLCAYQISEGGSDWRKVIVLDTRTKKMMDDTLVDVKFSGLSWKNNEGFYYSSYDKPKEGSQLSGKTQHHKLYFHKLGTPQNSDKLIFGGTETPRRYVGGSVTEDQQYLVISAANATYGNELYLQSLKEPNAPIVPMVEGFESEHDVVYSEDGKLYILTNAGAPNRRVAVTEATKPAIANWQPLIPQTQYPMSVSSCGGRLFVTFLKDAVSEVKQYDLNGQELDVVTLPGLGTASGFGGKKEDKELYYSFTSYVYPPTIFKYDIKTGKSELYKKSGVKFDPEQYESKQVFYASYPDGTQVPMIITY